MLPIQRSHQKLYKTFSSSRRVTRRQVMRHFMGNNTDQCRNGSSNILISYREQPQSTRIVVAYPRPAFSVTKQTNHASISYDQLAQVSQGHTSYRNRKTLNTEVHGEAGVRASIVPSKAVCIPEKAPRILPVRRSLLDPVGRKHIVVRDQLFPQKPSGSRL